jgi:hypothetical protein
MQEITRDGQTFTWPVPGDPGQYTVMVSVSDQPESGSSRRVQVYEPATQ